ncbi:hypothetical protein BS47DRAFT_980083 [Hydnum rufescens UP504]|uniref:Uncharacterized protein n=1 Tax=Hydnum rufescens UP504 TaxID=1448309 RepID=A0A9P6AX16_9AGAM|nr:hypothetical protein BS47DRAFT_980083 [Hydnum rufescens UP504]
MTPLRVCRLWNFLGWVSSSWTGHRDQGLSAHPSLVYRIVMQFVATADTSRRIFLLFTSHSTASRQMHALDP